MWLRHGDGRLPVSMNDGPYGLGLFAVLRRSRCATRSSPVLRASECECDKRRRTVTSFEGCDVAQSGSEMESRVMDGSMQPVFVQKGEGPKSAWAAWLGSGRLAWMIRGGRLLSVPWTSQFGSVQHSSRDRRPLGAAECSSAPSSPGKQSTGPMLPWASGRWVPH